MSQDVVQPDKWWRALPRASYAGLKQIPTTSDWFEIYELPNHVYALYEPHHFQEVISFLALGSQKALLIDTGMGIGNIKTVIEELTDLPITVVNTHTHFDHIGDNWRFDKVYVYDEVSAINRLTNGLDVNITNLAELKDNFQAEAFHYNKLAQIDYQNFKIKPCRFETIKEGRVFDLGNRQFRVIHTPGHSPDSLMLVNDTEKMLFTGDTIYPALMYAHFYDTVEIYAASVRRVATEFGDYQLYCSHNEPLRSGEMLSAVAAGFGQILKGEIRPEVGSDELKKYQFADFAIITR